MRPPVSCINRHSLVLSMAVAAVAAATPAAARPSVEPAAAIYRCDMPDGRVVFSDTRCQQGAKITAWRPVAVAPGLRRAEPVQTSSTPNGAGEPVGPTLTADVEPYQDCRARGGDYRIASRLCILPSAGPATAR